MQIVFGLGLVAALATLAPAAAAQADDSSARGKGVAGGILLGAELAAFSGAAFDLRPDWAFYSGIALGAAGGGLAGFVVERDAEERASDILLIAGMGLLVPVIVWVGDLRAPRPADRVELALAPRVPSAEGRDAGLTLALRAPW